jgi:diadenylate cyclase
VTALLTELSYIYSRLDWISLVDIVLVALAIYGLLALVRGTQAVVLIRGIVLLVITIAILTTVLPLQAVSFLLRNSLPALILAIPVIFAPEIRRALERLGRAGGALSLGWTSRESDIQAVVEAMASAAARLSQLRQGALIVIERDVGLKNYVDTGVPLDAAISKELLLQIFYPNTPLHDGAAVVRANRVAAAGCVLPLTSGESISEREVGLRHRAALGITEVSDAVAIVVSEETGIISVVHNGRMIRRLEHDRLQNVLVAFYRPGPQRSVQKWLRHPFGIGTHPPTGRKGAGER